MLFFSFLSFNLLFFSASYRIFKNTAGAMTEKSKLALTVYGTCMGMSILSGYFNIRKNYQMVSYIFLFWLLWLSYQIRTFFEELWKNFLIFLITFSISGCLHQIGNCRLCNRLRIVLPWSWLNCLPLLCSFRRMVNLLCSLPLQSLYNQCQTWLRIVKNLRLRKYIQLFLLRNNI